MLAEPRTEQPVPEQRRDESARQERIEPLADVVREVSRDAQISPGAYLRQTRVPADGE